MLVKCTVVVVCRTLPFTHSCACQQSLLCTVEQENFVHDFFCFFLKVTFRSNFIFVFGSLTSTPCIYVRLSGYVTRVSFFLLVKVAWPTNIAKINSKRNSNPTVLILV